MTVLVTGGTGTTGSRVAAGLAARGADVRVVSRSTPVPFDWHEPATHRAALDGVDVAYLVPPTTAADPAAVMVPFLERAGLRRAVLLSSSAVPRGGPGVGQVHDAVARLVPEWAVLRPSWFMQNVTGEHLHAQSIREHGEIVTATGAGRVGFVDADDIAAVAVHALLDDPAPDTDLVLTGPEALSYDDVAAILSDATGRPVRHRAQTVEQMRDRLAEHMPVAFATLLAGLDAAIATGVEDRTTDTVETITGRPPRSFASLLGHGARGRTSPLS